MPSARRASAWLSVELNGSPAPTPTMEALSSPNWEKRHARLKWKSPLFTKRQFMSVLVTARSCSQITWIKRTKSYSWLSRCTTSILTHSKSYVSVTHCCTRGAAPTTSSHSQELRLGKTRRRLALLGLYIREIKTFGRILTCEQLKLSN